MTRQPLLCRLGWHRWTDIFSSQYSVLTGVWSAFTLHGQVCTRCGKRRSV